jgi:hypothetical protein
LNTPSATAAHACERLLDIAAPDAACQQKIVRRSACTSGAPGAVAAAMPYTGGSRRPRDRDLIVADGHHDRPLADQRQHRLAAIAHDFVGSTGWSLMSG